MKKIDVMLRMGDSVMFATGSTSKVYQVTLDEFQAENGKTVVTLKGYHGLIEVEKLVKIETLFDGLQFEQEDESDHQEQDEEIKERYKLDEKDKLILEELKSHMSAGIKKLKRRNIRGVNIQLELTQHMLKQLE
jgi:hypothetical protein